MKIIDLLNKIANGEDVPEKIMYDHQTYFYDDECNDYTDYDGRYSLFGDKFLNGYGLVAYLNDEVEIIEEPKKIKKILTEKPSQEYIISDKNTDIEERMEIIRKNMYKLSLHQCYLADKINELIDEVKKLKGE